MLVFPPVDLHLCVCVCFVLYLEGENQHFHVFFVQYNPPFPFSLSPCASIFHSYIAHWLSIITTAPLQDMLDKYQTWLLVYRYNTFFWRGERFFVKYFYATLLCAAVWKSMSAFTVSVSILWIICGHFLFVECQCTSFWIFCGFIVSSKLSTQHRNKQTHLCCGKNNTSTTSAPLLSV